MLQITQIANSLQDNDLHDFLRQLAAFLSANKQEQTKKKPFLYLFSPYFACG
jgi:hypothetical protein